MTISNKHIGWILYLFISIAIYWWWFNAPDSFWEHDHHNNCRGAFFNHDYLYYTSIFILFCTFNAILHVLLFVVFFYYLLFEEVFKFYIPNPFSKMKIAYAERRLYLAELDEVYTKIRKTEDVKELKVLLDKAEVMEKQAK